MATSQGYTPMRGLIMDFRTDEHSATIGDQFMFGPAFFGEPGNRSWSRFTARLSAQSEMA